MSLNVVKIGDSQLSQCETILKDHGKVVFEPIVEVFFSGRDLKPGQLSSKPAVKETLAR